MGNTNNDWQAEYQRWLRRAEEPILTALREMDQSALQDAFWRDLTFGTGGLRGILGPGTNRMNVCTVAKATQGLADWLGAHAPGGRVAVSYDSRIGSKEFARVTSAVLAANGLRVMLYPRLMPTPCLSFAVRELGCAAGVMITASHNPANYNGYKVYGADGCQITTETAAAIQAAIQQVDIFERVRRIPFEEAVEKGYIAYIGEDVLTAYIRRVQEQSVLFGEPADRGVAIVYTPLNGTGLEPVTRVLKGSGFSNVTLVAEQAEPDGTFPTCPRPNPEIREAMEIGLGYCKKTGADLLLATDPDCDRCGIAVKEETGGYRLLTGNETGLLLLDFICAQRTKHGRMPADPVFIKTVVTADLAERIAARYGVKTVNVLTGFKYIGEQIGLLERQGREDAFICGFEESYGYLTGAYVRDKDGVNAAHMIAEMCAFYKARGISLLQKLNELYAVYGYSLQTQHSYAFEGAAGMETMARIMARLRGGVAEIGGLAVRNTVDYAPGLFGLPSSDVLKFQLEGDCSAVVRPSGTEPKLKVYISVTARDRAVAEEREKSVAKALEAYYT